MKTDKLKINHLAPETYEWYLSYLQAIDNKDIEAYTGFLANDCVMLSNNNSPVQGKAAILENLSHYCKTFSSLEHDLLNIYGNNSSFVLEALNDYARSDGKHVSVRAVVITERNKQGLVSSFRFYTDTTPIFE